MTTSEAISAQKSHLSRNRTDRGRSLKICNKRSIYFGTLYNCTLCMELLNVYGSETLQLSYCLIQESGWRPIGDQLSCSRYWKRAHLILYKSGITYYPLSTVNRSCPNWLGEGLISVLYPKHILHYIFRFSSLVAYFVSFHSTLLHFASFCFISFILLHISSFSSFFIIFLHFASFCLAPFLATSIPPSIRIRITLMWIRIHAFSDSDPIFHFNVDPDPDPDPDPDCGRSWSWLWEILILILITVLQTCDHCYTDRPPLSLYASIESVHCPKRIHFEPLKLTNFNFNSDPGPDFQFNADPDTDPTSKIMRI